MARGRRVVEEDSPSPPPKRQTKKASRKSGSKKVDEHNTSHTASQVEKEFEEDFYEDAPTQIIDDIFMPPPPVQPNLSGDQTGQRLIIENIEITNFKSYGGTCILGPFHKSFNSIVGPNGSGKSNVIDSMLFVFGYRASKIRSAKISNLIHKSDTMPDCTYAKVRVNFAMLDDKGGIDHEIVDDSRFSISRVVEKTNASYYMINQSKAVFRDVSKKLQDFGIDLRYNRFLILQGEVEQISLMKPKAETKEKEEDGDTGMLEFLEDIIGTSRYKVPIEALNQKYHELNEVRTGFLNKTNLCKKELTSVAEAKDEAVKALELANRQKIEQSKLLQLELYKESLRLQADEEAYAEEEEKMKALEKELQDIQTRKSELDASEKDKAKESKKLAAEQAELKIKFDEMKNNDYYIEEKRKKTREALKKVRKAIEEDNAKLATLRAAAEAIQDDSETVQLEEKRTELQEELKANEEEMKTQTEAAQEECAQLIKERDELDKALMSFKSEQSGKLNAMNEALNQFTLLKDQREKAKVKVDSMAAKLKKVEDETAEKTGKVAVYEREIPKQEDNLKEFKRRQVDLRQQFDRECELQTTKNEELQILKNDANRAQSRDQTRNALMAQVEQGNLQGIFGRLGALGGIDQKYDIAISTACGKLNGFVVDTMDNAVQASKYLKENKLGTAQFIALDSMQPWTYRYNERVSGNGAYPENALRLFDLVKVTNERFLPAFYFALSDTLVAETIDQANAISIAEKPKRYRVVSLRGDIVDTDGSMSGGGRPRSGGMGTSVAETRVDRSQIMRLEEEVQQHRSRREQLQYQLEALNRDFEQLERDLKLMIDNLGAFQLDLTQNGKRIELFTEQLSAHKAEYARFENNPEIEAAEVEYQKRKKIYDKEEAKMNQQQEELDKYDVQIQERLNSRLEPIKKAKKAIEKKLKELNAKVNAIAGDRKTTELNLKKTEDSLASNEANREKLEAEQEKNKADRAEIEKTAEGVTAKYEQSGQMVEAIEEELKGIRAEVKKLEEEVKKIKSKELDQKHVMDKKFKVLDEKRTQKKVYQGKLREIELYQINDIDSDEDEDDEEEGDEEDDEEEYDESHSESLTTQKQPTENSDEQEPPSEQMDVDTMGGEQVPTSETAKSVREEEEEEVEAPTEETNGEKRKGARKNRKKKEPVQIPQLTAEQLAAMTDAHVKQIERHIKEIKEELARLTPNYEAIEEYRKKRQEMKERNAELGTITMRRDTYMEHLKTTKDKRFSEFKKGFYSIATKLKELYRTITLGGDADLEFVDSLDPFAEGINFAVRPNKKSWKNNINLSGGEKTLASLALIFALHYYKPSPLYIMDEIDAALDFKNVSIIANYIKQRTRNTQFLIISLRNNMYELAEILIGVYKTHNVSKTIAFDPIAFEHDLQTGTGSQMTGFGSQGTANFASQQSTQSSQLRRLPPPPPKDPFDSHQFAMPLTDSQQMFAMSSPPKSQPLKPKNTGFTDSTSAWVSSTPVVPPPSSVLTTMIVPADSTRSSIDSSNVDNAEGGDLHDDNTENVNTDEGSEIEDLMDLA